MIMGNPVSWSKARLSHIRDQESSRGSPRPRMFKRLKDSKKWKKLKVSNVAGYALES